MKPSRDIALGHWNEYSTLLQPNDAPEDTRGLDTSVVSQAPEARLYRSREFGDTVMGRSHTAKRYPRRSPTYHERNGHPSRHRPHSTVDTPLCVWSHRPMEPANTDVRAERVEGQQVAPRSVGTVPIKKRVVLQAEFRDSWPPIGVDGIRAPGPIPPIMYRVVWVSGRWAGTWPERELGSSRWYFSPEAAWIDFYTLVL